MLQRAAVHEHVPAQVPDIIYDVLKSPGQPLDRGTREFMEQRFNHDFSAVRVHTDARAAESARAVNARAYTVTSDVVFGRDRYRPSSIDGRRLLAHELTHVIQQQGSTLSSSSGLVLGARDDDAEATAAVAADQIAAGRNFRLNPGQSAGVLQREYVEENAAGCGVCSSAGSTGRQVHETVLPAYANAYGLTADAPYFPLEGEHKKPDFRRIIESQDTVFIEIGELKPHNSLGIKRGRAQLEGYERQIRKALEVAGKNYPAKKFSLSRLDDVATFKLKFRDQNSGNCAPADQSITVDHGGEGLFLYSCNPRRSQLSAGGCCDRRKRRDEPLSIPVHDGRKNADADKSRDRKEQSKSSAAPGPDIDLSNAAMGAIAAFILKNLTLDGQAEQMNAVAGFLSKHRDLVAVIGLSAAGLLLALAIPATIPALALAALIISAVSTSKNASDRAPPMI
ncbi:MAG: DUF4157 domain-containing protein [Rhizobiales bacterium]|nr:DUF4157 domain-containing protein [Hyphomicrobiales bacterium]